MPSYVEMDLLYVEVDLLHVEMDLLHVEVGLEIVAATFSSILQQKIEIVRNNKTPTN